MTTNGKTLTVMIVGVGIAIAAIAALLYSGTMTTNTLPTVQGITQALQ